MDATCNGLQHLSAMALDITLAEKVNLLESYEHNEPKDIYSEVIPYIEESINTLVKENVEYYNLSLLKITRKLIKRGIMTITYGVTVKGILNQLLCEHFIKFDDKHSLYKPLNPDIGNNIVLKYRDLYKLSEIIYNSLFQVHDSLKSVMKYFHNIVKLLNKLNLPIQ